MTDKASEPRPARKDEPAAPDQGASSDEKRRKAAAALLNPAIAPAAAGAMLDADPRLDDRSETERALERASRTPD